MTHMSQQEVFLTVEESTGHHGIAAIISHYLRVHNEHHQESPMMNPSCSEREFFPPANYEGLRLLTKALPLNLSLGMEVVDGTPWTGICTIVAVDSGTTSYLACSICERALPESVSSSHCRYCNHNAFNPGSFGSKRLYRLHLSVATSDKVMTVMCFDRMAQALFGCSADAFFDFCKLNPCAVEAACQILEGGMFKMTLNRPKSGNAQHLRITSLVPLSSEFQPVIEILKKVYEVDPSDKLQRVETSTRKRKCS